MNNKEYSNIVIPNVEHDYNYYEKLYPKRNLPENAMITRFAPSPTGFVHIGSLCSALVNVVFARQTSGIVYLRIEDTDTKRTIENGIDGIFNDFKNLNIVFDEYIGVGLYGPYIQSERMNIYKSFAKKLIEQDLAYPCFCTVDDLEHVHDVQESNKDRYGYYGEYAKCRNLTREEAISRINKGENYIIRLKSTGSYNKKIILDDKIKGKIEMPENDLDIVLIKSDGLPTYHFAHAIDDHLMGTTHVIRADEWISSYSIHEQLFRILEFKLPKYAHLSPINIKDGSSVRKLSKRKDKEAAISYYDKIGIPSDVIKLYLATIINSNFEQWYNENSDKSINDFKFDFKKMSTSGAIFDIEKLINISKTYFSRMKSDILANNILEYFKVYDNDFYNIISKDKNKLIKILDVERYIKRPRKDMSSYSDYKKYFWYMYDELFDLINLEKKSFYDINMLTEYVNLYYDDTDEKDVWFDKIKILSEKYGFAKEVKLYRENPSIYKGHIGDVCELIRVMATSSYETPDLYELLKIIGKDSLLVRLEKFKEYI